MSEYRRICESNKVLYGQLEALSHEINHCKANNTPHDIDLLTEAKESVKRQIDVNLELLERHWDTHGATARMRQTTESVLVPNKQELAVIKTFTANPDMTMAELTIVSQVTNARSIITKFLNKRYIGI